MAKQRQQDEEDTATNEEQSSSNLTPTPGSPEEEAANKAAKGKAASPKDDRDPLAVTARQYHEADSAILDLDKRSATLRKTLADMEEKKKNWQRTKDELRAKMQGKS